jgi:hypothetical protein
MAPDRLSRGGGVDVLMRTWGVGDLGLGGVVWRPSGGVFEIGSMMRHELEKRSPLPRIAIRLVLCSHIPHNPR